jgi:hypothetical protein
LRVGGEGTVVGPGGSDAVPFPGTT